MNMKNNNMCKLPKIYEHKGRKCYLDPIRKKLVYITPEETVRQKVISYLVSNLKVPAEMIKVEEHLSHYGIKSKKRADIIIHKIDKDCNEVPIVVIECKAPNVYLDEKARIQMLEYCILLKADYAMMTNSIEEWTYKYDHKKDTYQQIEQLPLYKDILSNYFTVFEKGELPPRIPFYKLEMYLMYKFEEEKIKGYVSEDISANTPMTLAVAAFNLLECLLDTRVKMPKNDYGMFRLIKDYGVRMLSYGNAAGGRFYGPYRSFLVDVNGNAEFFSLSVTTYWKGDNIDKMKTCIVVAHDDEKEAHHALQLVVDDNLKSEGEKITFYHNGKITIGKMGSGKIDGLKKLVKEKYSAIISNNVFCLGSIDNNRLWKLNDPQVIKVIVNLISYSIIRDEYREYVKESKNMGTLKAMR